MKLNKKLIIVIVSFFLVVVIVVVLFFLLKDKPNDNNGSNGDNSNETNYSQNGKNGDEEEKNDNGSTEQNVIDYSVALSRLKEKGIIENQFDDIKLTDLITRAEFLKIIYELKKELYDEYFGEMTTTTFSDVPKNHWANKYIAFFEDEIIDTTSNFEFKPDAVLLFEDAIKFILRLYGEHYTADDLGGTFETYYKIADEIGFVKNIQLSKTDKINYYTAIMLIYNTNYTEETGEYIPSE